MAQHKQTHVGVGTAPGFHLHTWCLSVSVMMLALYVSHDLGYLDWVFLLDRSRVTWVISALVVVGSCHALWHLRVYTHRLMAAEHAINDTMAKQLPDQHLTIDPSAHAFIAGWTNDMQGSSASEKTAAQGDLLDVYADQLRAPIDLGWFLVDVTVRLGLLGTIIGFILIFTSLTGVSIDAADGLRDLLVAMSGGMGTALLTTLAGLIGATLLSVQYLIAGRAAEQLVGQLVRLRCAGS